MNDTMSLKEKKTYVYLYKKNRLSYTLALLAVLTELIYVISILDVMEVSYWMGVTVMFNIFLLFEIFSLAAKVEFYNRKAAFALIFLAVYVLLRQTVIVPFVLKPYGRKTVIMLFNIFSIVLLLLSGFIAAERSDRRNKLQQKLANSNDGN
jgi:FtsH-binding integral membrane protein